MVSLANYMTTIRRVTFLTTLLFSLIVLSLSAALVSSSGPFYSAFSALALATSLLTLFTVGPMFFVDWYRKGTYFSYIIVEVSCLSFLWILWLSSGASAAQKETAISNVYAGVSGSGCSWSPTSRNPQVPGYGHDLKQACNEIKALIAFSFLTWILLIFYAVTLLVLALRARSQGHNVWQAAVSDGVLLYTSEKVVGGAPQGMAPQPAVHQFYPPPVQQYTSQPAQQYTSQPTQQYISQPAQQYTSQPAQQYISQPAQQSIPTSVSHVYPQV